MEVQTEASDRTTDRIPTKDQITDSELHSRIQRLHSLRTTEVSEPIQETVIQTADSEIIPETIRIPTAEDSETVRELQLLKHSQLLLSQREVEADSDKTIINKETDS